MNILFVTPSYKPAYIYGGPIVVIALLAESLAALGHQVTVYTTTANGKSELDQVPGKMVSIDGVNVIYFKRISGDHTHISPALWSYLNKHVREFDVVHIHSWWNILVLGAAIVCKRNKVVSVISPHGMFSNYILETNNSVVKKWIHRIVGRDLLKSSRLHVSTDMEWHESQKIIPGWKGMVIPNLVTLSEQHYQRQQNAVFTIGFLSRVDPKKGLDILIKALAGVKFKYKLLIAGSGEDTYVKSLKELSESVGNSEYLEWVGWKKGEDKFRFLAALDLFALTSHSENFAIVVIESLSVGTPVLVSDQVGLYEYVQQNDYGWVSSKDVSEIIAKLNSLYQQKEKINRINLDVPALVKEEYNPSKLAGRYIDLYVQ